MPVLVILAKTFRSLSVPLLGIWGAIGYAPPLVLRQYRSRQFIPTTQENIRADQWEKKFQYA
ncbi:hypothetical protein Goarm_021744 [Gossypium armourianum]|uniref:Uncharacterized protein n=1 Tax=Gossypium armourianum TaxID=34283 RepID=A0A7J9IU65_9ROSI|nr:hypothetical protein [Gossypium armourianum]